MIVQQHLSCHACMQHMQTVAKVGLDHLNPHLSTHVTAQAAAYSATSKPAGMQKQSSTTGCCICSMPPRVLQLGVGYPVRQPSNAFHQSPETLPTQLYMYTAVPLQGLSRTCRSQNACAHPTPTHGHTHNTRSHTNTSKLHTAQHTATVHLRSPQAYSQVISRSGAASPHTQTYASTHCSASIHPTAYTYHLLCEHQDAVVHLVISSSDLQLIAVTCLCARARCNERILSTALGWVACLPGCCAACLTQGNILKGRQATAQAAADGH